MKSDTSTLRVGKSNLPLSKIFQNRGDDIAVQIALTNHYSHDLGTLTGLFDIARRDFPDANLELTDVNPIVFGGRRCYGMWGINFTVPANVKMPEDYTADFSEPKLAGG